MQLQQRQRHVYVTTYGNDDVNPDNDDNDDDPNNTHRHGSHKWAEVAQQIAKDLNLPYWDPTLEHQLDHNKNNIDDDEDYEHFHRCTHVLDVMTYGDTYALGIRQRQSQSHSEPQTQVHSTTTPSSKAQQQQRQKQKQSKHRSLSRAAGSQTPYVVDFCPLPHSRMAKRIQSSSSGSSDLLIKAVALHKINKGKGGASGTGPRIWDLTAGFGQDSLLLLEHGASEVCMIERDPIVAALLQDALRRRDRTMTTGTTPTTATTNTKKLSLWIGNAIDIIQSMSVQQHDTENHDHHPLLPTPVDVCYLDPMFPPRTKSAAVKKNMQILHSLLDSQQQPSSPQPPSPSLRMENDTNTTNRDDPLELLEAALLVAQSRVVVKRPIHAPPLGLDSNSNDTNSSRTGRRIPKPSFEICGSVNRFDVYVTKSGN